MGANTWRDEQEWPLARAAATPFYFHSGGKANTLNGDGTLSQTAPSDERSDRFVYDPWNPVPTGQRGGYSRMPTDQQRLERRQDVLVYTTAPLDDADGSDGADRGAAVGVVVGDRHRLHREAGRRFPRRHGADAERRHPPRALSQRQDDAGAADAGATGGAHHRRRRDEQPVRGRAPHPRRDLRAAISRASIATRTPARRSARARSFCAPSRRCFTIASGRRGLCCRWWGGRRSAALQGCPTLILKPL